MNKKYILPTNLSKLGFRYFRIVIETKSFSKKFIDFITTHPNTGFVFQGHGWSGKKKVLGIGIWATSNSEMIDVSNNIRSRIPEAYNIVYQSELTRLEFFTEVNGTRKNLTLLDEPEDKTQLTPLELDYIKLLSVDGSLPLPTQAKILNISDKEVTELTTKLKDDGVCYDLVENKELPDNYTKLFIDTTSLSVREIDEYVEKLSTDKNCVYLARGNGKYNFEFEYIVKNEEEFGRVYKKLLNRSKQILFDKNLFTNLFPQSKYNNIKKIQDEFIKLAKKDTSYFDLRNSELWYLNHEGAKAYLNVASNKKYDSFMNSGEFKLLEESARIFAEADSKYNIIDLGSGDGSKGKHLINEIGVKKIKSYFPVDIQELELAQAVRTHGEQPYSIHPTILNFKNLSSRFPVSKKTGDVNVFGLLGATYGNFAPSEINSYLKCVLEDKNDALLITMPISDNITHEQIIKSYLNETVENFSFSVLKQIGFTKLDFEKNQSSPEFILLPRIEEGKLTSSFILKDTKYILGERLDPGTKFDITTSWKPTKAEFLEAVSADFKINKIFTNNSTCLAMCSKQ